MSLKHAILVLLEKDPGSGYDLVQRFKSGIGHFWNATHQQVYQELRKLSDEGLLSYKVEAQDERPDRKVYRITREGLKALKTWQQEPIKPPRINNALLVKVFGTRDTDIGSLLVQLDEHLATHQRRLDEYLDLERSYLDADRETKREHRLPYLTLRMGIRYEQHWIDWLMETRELLREDHLPEQPTLSDPSRTSRRERASVPISGGRARKPGKRAPT